MTMTPGPGGDDLFGGAGGDPAGERPAAGRAADRAWTVSEAVGAVRTGVRSALGQVWIAGELGEVKVHRSGHWYFTLRDADAQIRCVMWKANASRHRRAPAAGTEVYLLARPDVWTDRGELQFTAVKVLPTAGVGARQLELLRTREALTRDGLLDPGRRRPLPPDPAVIAIVSSVDGAALRDMAAVARRRWPAVRLLVVGATVQGDAAERTLLQALALVNRLPVDLCILGRGGGAREDLAVFDREAVCRAVAAVRVPVISAVGHETDRCLVDLVADLSASTPTAAMEQALPDVAERRHRIGALGERLAGGLRRRTALVTERLFRADDRLRHAIERRLARPRDQVAGLGARLDALSPLRVLERGYSVARGPDGRVLRRLADLGPGTRFRLRVADGEVKATSEGPA